MNKPKMIYEPLSKPVSPSGIKMASLQNHSSAELFSQANSLFIFIETLILALQQCYDSEEFLKEMSQGSVSAGLAKGAYLNCVASMGCHVISRSWDMTIRIWVDQIGAATNEPLRRTNSDFWTETAGLKWQELN
jgi:hypothetical protein